MSVLYSFTTYTYSLTANELNCAQLKVNQMTLQDFASFTELFSSIAVLATLIFVGFQIRQTNVLLQRGEENVTMEEWSRIRLSIVENHDVANIWQARLDDGEELDATQLVRLHTLLEEYLWAAYHIWDRTRRNLFVHGRFEETMPVLRQYLNNRHGIKWWSGVKVNFPPSYVRDVDAILTDTT